MEYWGIDRSCTSLRLKALDRLGRLEGLRPTGDIRRISSRLPAPSDGHPLKLNQREFELLLALAKNANNAKDDRTSVANQLTSFLVKILDLEITAPVSHYETAPWYAATRAVTSALIKLESTEVFSRYLARARELWQSRLTNEGVVKYAFSLRGFFEGLTEAPFSPAVGAPIFEWTRDNITTDFLSSLHASLSAAETHLTREHLTPELETLVIFQQDVLAYPGPTQLGMAVADFVRHTTRSICGTQHNALQVLLSTNEFDPKGQSPPEALDMPLLRELVDFAVEHIKLIDSGFQFRLEQFPQLIPLTARSLWYFLEPLGAAVFYGVYESDAAMEVIGSLMEADQVDSKDEALLNVVRVAMICVKGDERRMVLLVRSFCSYLGAVSSDTAKQVGAIFMAGTAKQSQTLLVSTIYTLINSLNIDEYMLRKRQYEMSASSDEKLPRATPEDHEPFGKYAASILSAVASMVIHYNDSQIYALLITVLSQKYNSVSLTFDAQVLSALAYLAPHTAENNFVAILTLISTIEHDAVEKRKEGIITAVAATRTSIAAALNRDSKVYAVYLKHLLGLMVEKGEVVDQATTHTHHKDLGEAAIEATRLFEPLAMLLPGPRQTPYETNDRDLQNKFRNAWLNLVVLGFSNQTNWTKTQRRQLTIIARSSPPLVMEASTNQVDSDLELNPVLRRGSTHTNINTQRRILGGFFNREVRAMSFLRLMFVSAIIFLEHCRTRGGIVSKLPYYFGDPVFREGDGLREMQKIATNTAFDYISHVTKRRPNHPEFDLDNVANQFREILVLCCHRVEAIRKSALSIANIFISSVPSALCHKTSMFSLLDLLTLMWQSCVDAEQDAYEPTSTFKSARSQVEIHLSDSYEMRRVALKELLSSARNWCKEVLALMSEEVKVVLTLYLDDLEADYLASNLFDTVALGRSFALELGGSIRDSDSILTSHHGFSQSNPDHLANGTSGFLAQYLSLSEYKVHSTLGYDEATKDSVQTAFSELAERKNPKPQDLKPQQLRQLYVRSSQFISRYDPFSLFVAKNAVHIPFRFFGGASMKVAISYWIWMFNATPELRMPIMQEVASHWTRSIDRRIGLFSRKLDNEDPMFAEMQYVPTEKKEIEHSLAALQNQYDPHVHLIHFLKSSFHASICVKGTEYLDLYARMVTVAMKGLCMSGSQHALARTLRMELLKLALDVLQQFYKYRPVQARKLQQWIVKAGLSWYKQSAKWPFGGNLIQQRKDMVLLRTIAARTSAMFGTEPPAEVISLLYFLQEELNRLEVWYEPLGKGSTGNFTVTADLVNTVWSVDPELAVFLVERSYDEKAYAALVAHIAADPLAVVSVPQALLLYLDASRGAKRTTASNIVVLYWAQSSPIQSISLFDGEKYDQTSYLSQYAMRSLESHPITTCFFYVPQIVQLLRHDKDGYVEEYILEAAKFSQLFAHQIIWNILANSYRDDDGNEPDPMKPTLDRVVERMKSSFSEEERQFYDREFSFFNDVTSISGKLKPYIKKSKAEKKAKIDEEMAQIKLPDGVYLPSHPLGTVIDIDRDSGRPLQSHAKAPFLARFKIQQEETEFGPEGESYKVTTESWQGAIFKVGDDCRQDVLALQLISVFRNIFNASGLDAYVFPNKVTATAPGCGIIDVLPNSISRDMLGREAVNGLYEWFISKHGGEDSIAFQRARNNFVKSMAAYSIISYLLQFKDRHNGNIMYDDDGHVIHIDFGFCFDIVPGGVKFEAAPFKLTKEMVAVMGGSPNTQAYKWFEELCVKVFLTCRLYYDEICCVVEPMLESGLPCFKPDTMKKLKARFVLHKSEREAAQYVRSLIHKSYESTFTTVYDEFQRITNGIPY